MSDGKREKPLGKKHNPRRGGPGMLLTCETGREKKCRREGLDILRHYLDTQSEDSDAKNNKIQLSLEEEITLLQQGATSDHVLSGSSSKAFTVYETGCRGSVFFMCTLPNSFLIPPIRPQYHETVKRKAPEEEDENRERTKKARTEKDEPTANNDESTANNEKPPEKPTPQNSNVTGNVETEPPWDPLNTVQRVLKDLDTASKTAPSSRFVTRMIPIQATCFASTEEIGLTAKGLIEKYLRHVKPSTYSVVVKRRNCSSVTRDEVIFTITKELLASGKSWKADLSSPDYTFRVEICKTLCGISIIPNSAAYRNFNLVEVRQAKSTSDEKEEHAS